MPSNQPLTNSQITCLKKGESIYILRRNNLGAFVAQVTSVGKRYITSTSVVSNKTARFDAVTGREADTYCTIFAVFDSKESHLNWVEGNNTISRAESAVKSYLQSMSVKDAQALLNFIEGTKNV